MARRFVMAIKNAVEHQRQTDLRKYKALVKKHQRDFVETGTALGMIRVQGLHKEAGYASFEEFVESEFDMPKTTAYRLIDAARVVTILSQVGTIQSKITNQSQALQLVPLGRDKAAMVAVIEGAEARGSKITAASLEAVRTELYPHVKVIDGEIVGDRLALEGADDPIDEDDQTAAEAASRLADGGTDTTSAVPPAAGPGPTEPSGEADRPGPAVNPTDITEDDAVSDDVQEQPPVPGSGVSRDARPADPEELTSPLSGEADPEQGGTGVTRPAPDPSDPAALLEWFAERWEQVDADVSGPLLTDDDVLLLEASLNRIAFTFELLIKWRERAQP
jgi:hypothetical protein